MQPRRPMHAHLPSQPIHFSSILGPLSPSSSLPFVAPSSSFAGSSSYPGPSLAGSSSSPSFAGLPSFAASSSYSASSPSAAYGDASRFPGSPTSPLLLDPLLTPTERNAFDAFLSSAAREDNNHNSNNNMDISPDSPTHSHHTSNSDTNSHPHHHNLSSSHAHAHSHSSLQNSAEPDLAEWQLYSHLGITLPPAPPDALSKATKELIALRMPVGGGSSSNGGAAPHSTATSHRPIAPAPPISHSNSTATATPARPSKRARTLSQSHAHSQMPIKPKGGSPVRSDNRASPVPTPAKPTLLTTQQKKANHIQSEQKRRANIRRGYEALCETIPTLREAIKAEEGEGGGGEGRGGRRKRGRDDGEKADGRAGPRSESVVLQKTIEHIQALLDEKTSLLSRLERARSALGQHHTHFSGMNDTPIWERKWDGGKGLMVDSEGRTIDFEGEGEDGEGSDEE